MLPSQREEIDELARQIGEEHEAIVAAPGVAAERPRASCGDYPGIGVREKPPMKEIESLVAGFKSDVALAVGQHRRIVGAGNVGNFCKSIDFHRQRYGAKLEGLRHQGFDGAEIDAAAAQIARLANDAIDKAQRSGVVEFHRR
jgi:hypothetical protein